MAESEEQDFLATLSRIGITKTMDVANFCDQLDNDKKRNFVDDQFIALLRTLRVQDESKISLLVRSLSHFVLQVAIKC